MMNINGSRPSAMKALRLSGRLKVMVAIPSEISTLIPVFIVHRCDGYCGGGKEPAFSGDVEPL